MSMLSEGMPESFPERDKKKKTSLLIFRCIEALLPAKSKAAQSQGLAGSQNKKVLLAEAPVLINQEGEASLSVCKNGHRSAWSSKQLDLQQRHYAKTCSVSNASLQGRTFSV